MPCSGKDAIAHAKTKAEELLEAPCAFKSYHEGVNRPERQQLDDDEKVLRGSILNFTGDVRPVLAKQHLHNRLLKGLFKRQFHDLLSKFGARFFKAPQEPMDVVNKGSLQAMLAQPACQLREDLQTLLRQARSTLSVEDVVGCLYSSYHSRNTSTHVNTNAQLRAEAEQLVNDGAVELLETDMPVECFVITHMERFLQLLRRQLAPSATATVWVLVDAASTPCNQAVAL